jgi:hypothetical protein
MKETAHRRDFVRALALGVPAALVVPARGDEPKKADEPKKDAAKTEADARFELVLARFGDQLDEDARKTIRSQLDVIVRNAEALRKVPLENGDGPFPVFHPYRAPLA